MRDNRHTALPADALFVYRTSSTARSATLAFSYCTHSDVFVFGLEVFEFESKKSPAGDGTAIIDRSRFWLRIWWAGYCSASFCDCGDTDLSVSP